MYCYYYMGMILRSLVLTQYQRVTDGQTRRLCPKTAQSRAATLELEAQREKNGSRGFLRLNLLSLDVKLSNMPKCLSSPNRNSLLLQFTLEYFPVS